MRHLGPCAWAWRSLRSSDLSRAKATVGTGRGRNRSSSALVSRAYRHERRCRHAQSFHQNRRPAARRQIRRHHQRSRDHPTVHKTSPPTSEVGSAPSGRSGSSDSARCRRSWDGPPLLRRLLRLLPRPPSVRVTRRLPRPVTRWPAAAAVVVEVMASRRPRSRAAHHPLGGPQRR